MNFLDDVLDGVRQSLVDGYYEVGKMEPDAESRTQGKKSLKTELQQRFSIIAEIKPRSPTAGVLYQGSAADLAKTYAEAGAGALSVLCESKRFNGRLENLTEAKTAATHLPVLAKDFVISKKQLQAYAAHGADAALLIYELFEHKKTNVPLEAMIDAAHELGLEVLLEVHGAKDLDEALKSKADVIGINNRNLDDLSLNMLHFQNVLSESGVDIEKITAEGKALIAESGFVSAADVQMARDVGLNGILIGTGLLKNKDPAFALKQLTKITKQTR
ncbi:indole-3-glycerol-phosphate synthase [Candidatus Micrarchaeota archaeon]|nr:indole-3-glycerol-phosphate synthase [Candidatus Micrarchaeota archaeon]